MEITRRNCSRQYLAVSHSLAACDCGVNGRLERGRCKREPGRRDTMHQVTRMHRTLVVLAVGLLALAAPLVALSEGPIPTGH